MLKYFLKNNKIIIFKQQNNKNKMNIINIFSSQNQNIGTKTSSDMHTFLFCLEKEYNNKKEENFEFQNSIFTFKFK